MPDCAGDYYDTDRVFQKSANSVGDFSHHLGFDFKAESGNSATSIETGI
jgi:hypothetical protein